MKITIISIYSFPHGMASSTRVASLCRGLAEQGVEISVVVPEAPLPYDSKDSMPDKGEWKGVRYFHLQGRKRNGNKILRALAKKSGFRFWNGLRLTKEWLKTHPSEVVIIYNDNTKFLGKYVEVAKNSGAKVLFNFDEFPVPIREQGASCLPTWKINKYREILNNVDGYIAINKILADFYKNIVSKPSLELSMVVDTDRFDGRQLRRKEQLTYMGQILPDKDNVGNIIKAFDLIKDEYPNLTFHIYGKGNATAYEDLKRMVADLGLDTRIFFEGFVPMEEVPNIMAQSKIMVSSQPDNERVRGCLSTKLAEYVAMATPTLMCDVGENRTYLSDEDCFFTVPDNPQKYAYSIKRILDDYDNAISVADHGRKTIISKYSYNSQSKSLLKFAIEISK